MNVNELACKQAPPQIAPKGAFSYVCINTSKTPSQIERNSLSPFPGALCCLLYRQPHTIL